MEKVKKDYIDRIILESFQETVGDIQLKFLNNLTAVQSALEEDGIDDDNGSAALFLSCIITAQTNAIATMRKTLHRLFCDDNGLEAQTTETGGNEHAQNP